MTLRVGLSFDLLGTLLGLHLSSGYQYGLDMRRFLQKKGLHSPPINESVLEENFSRGIRTELARDRAVWVAKHLDDAEEMPIGGVTSESTLNFWCRVVESVYDREGAFCGRDKSVLSVLQEAQKGAEWNDFIKSVVMRFSTPEPYVWLPEALPTLRLLRQWRETQIPPGVQCCPPALVSNSDTRLISALRGMLALEDGAPLLGQLLSADVVGKSKPSPLGILLAAKAMIRQSLDVVPTVIPKYRLEEDARLATERRQQLLEATTAQQVNRYRVTCCNKVTAEKDGIERDGTVSLRLFSLLPSPGLGSRVPRSLRVLEAPKATWKHVRRTVYSASMCNSTEVGGTDEINGVRGDEDECECEEDDGDAPRFTSLPLPEYENMSCLLLTLPQSDAEDAALAQVRPLDTPLHVLHYERLETKKEGQGISSSWYSGMDVRSVGFKRSYIDDDGTEEDDHDGGADGLHGASDHAISEKQQKATKRDNKLGTRAGKKSRMDNISNDGLIGVDAEVTAKPQAVDHRESANEEAPVSVLPSSAAILAAGEGSKAAPELDFTGVDAQDLQSLTASLLQQWAAAGKVAAPFTEVAKFVLKSHPSYAEMKAKHMSSNSRQEAVNWFRVSQSDVRTHILHLGYTIDSTNNVYLSQHRKH